MLERKLMLFKLNNFYELEITNQLAIPQHALTTSAFLCRLFCTIGKPLHVHGREVRLRNVFLHDTIFWGVSYSGVCSTVCKRQNSCVWFAAGKCCRTPKLVTALVSESSCTGPDDNCIGKIVESIDGLILKDLYRWMQN